MRQMASADLVQMKSVDVSLAVAFVIVATSAGMPFGSEPMTF